MFKKYNELVKVKDEQNKELDEVTFDYINSKAKYNIKKFNLQLETNFKDLGLTNKEMRDAYVEKNLIDEKSAYQLAELEIKSIKRRIDLIDDLINLETIKLTKGE